MHPGTHKSILLPLVASLSAYEMWYYFQNAEEQLVEAINNNNYPRVDAIINYRIPKENIVEVIDILFKNVKCTEIQERYCKAAIESALKLVDRSIDIESSNKSIKLAVSLALSVGKGSKISDEVLDKIKGSEAFSEIIDIAKGYLNDYKDGLEIKDEAINFLLRISDKAPKELIPDLIEILLPMGRANKISDDVLNKITDDESFSKIIDKISYSINMYESKKITDSLVELISKISKITGWSYMPYDENGVTVLNNIAQYLLKLDKLCLRYPEQVEKLEDAINNMLYKCIDNNCLFQGVETLKLKSSLSKVSFL